MSDDPSAEGPEGRFLCHRHTQRPRWAYPECYFLPTFGILSTMGHLVFWPCPTFNPLTSVAVPILPGSPCPYWLLSALCSVSSLGPRPGSPTCPTSPSPGLMLPLGPTPARACGQLSS